MKAKYQTFSEAYVINARLHHYKCLKRRFRGMMNDIYGIITNRLHR